MSSSGNVTSELPSSQGEERVGALLVFLSAFFWSFGGTISRFIETGDNWTIVFWRSIWAALSILAFLFWRDGLRGTLKAFTGMGVPGFAVAICFVISSIAFIIALSHTTVANILLVQAGVPLLAALIGRLVFAQPVSFSTWLAIAAVILGVAIMVSESFTGEVSPIGDGLSLTIAVALAIATVITRRYSHVRMTPATCLSVIIAAVVSFMLAGSLTVSAPDMAWLFAFGALNLGLGLALFATGARLIPAAFAALLGTFEPILGPIWVWLVHGEVPSGRTVVGGVIVVTALLVYLALEFRRQRQPRRPGVTGVPSPT